MVATVVTGETAIMDTEEAEVEAEAEMGIVGVDMAIAGVDMEAEEVGVLNTETVAMVIITAAIMVIQGNMEAITTTNQLLISTKTQNQAATFLLQVQQQITIINQPNKKNHK